MELVKVKIGLLVLVLPTIFPTHTFIISKQIWEEELTTWEN
jgi:hypothetical protein